MTREGVGSCLLRNKSGMGLHVGGGGHAHEGEAAVEGDAGGGG